MTDIKEEKRKKERSAAYPAVPLNEAIELVKKIRDALGSSWSSRDTTAKAMGYGGVTGTSSPRIAALVHFGLLERKGDTYRPSALSERILLPLDDAEKERGVREALHTPKLFATLLEEYRGKSLPGMLHIVLIRSHGIAEAAAKRVSEIFQLSTEFAGVLKNGVLSAEGEGLSGVHVTESTEAVPQAPSRANAADTTRPASASAPQVYQQLVLPCKKIVLSIAPELAYALATGELAEEIRNLNEKAAHILASQATAQPSE